MLTLCRDREPEGPTDPDILDTPQPRCIIVHAVPEPASDEPSDLMGRKSASYQPAILRRSNCHFVLLKQSLVSLYIAFRLRNRFFIYIRISQELCNVQRDRERERERERKEKKKVQRKREIT